MFSAPSAVSAVIYDWRFELADCPHPSTPQFTAEHAEIAEIILEED